MEFTIRMPGTAQEIRVLNARWRELAQRIVQVLPDAQVLHVRVRLGGRMSQGISVFDEAFAWLDLGPLLPDVEGVLEESLDLLGPGWFYLRRSEVFRRIAT